jgi:hypothetical protein
MLNPSLLPVIEHFGSVDELADALHCTRQAVYRWGDYIPSWRALQIETLTKGRFKAKSFPQRSTVRVRRAERRLNETP